MPDYSKGKIYKITSPNTNNVYIGSTIRTLKARMYNHMFNFRNCAPKACCASYNVIKYQNAQIELIEYFPCTTIQELEARELLITRQYREDPMHNVVNIQENGKSDVEKKEHKANIGKAYREKLGDELLLKKREYHHANKERIAARSKEYREQNKEDIHAKKKEYYVKNKEVINAKNKEYIQAHHDRKLETDREYYQKNKEKYAEYSKRPWTCEHCNKTITLGGKSNHLKSKSHLDKVIV